MARTLTQLRVTFLSEEGWLSSSREADLVKTLQNHENWEFKVNAGGHWAMLTIPDELSALLQGIRVSSPVAGDSLLRSRPLDRSVGLGKQGS